VLVYYFVYLQSDSPLPLAVHRSGLAPHVYGLCMALNGVVICLAQPILAPRLIRRDPGRVWAAGVALVGVGFGLTAIASTTGGYLLSVASGWPTSSLGGTPLLSVSPLVLWDPARCSALHASTANFGPGHHLRIRPGR
jgi:hypothetical protein